MPKNIANLRKLTLHKNLFTSGLSEQKSAAYTVLGKLFCVGGLYKFENKSVFL